jgi:hypothetical protein
MGGPPAGPDDVEKRKFLILPGLELRPLGRPARSQSLYRLRYPGKNEKRIVIKHFLWNLTEAKGYRKDSNTKVVHDDVENVDRDNWNLTL